jgi:hypothetical protein
MEAEVCSRLAACSSVRCDRSVVLVEISTAALETSLPTDLIWEGDVTGRIQGRGALADVKLEGARGQERPAIR